MEEFRPLIVDSVVLTLLNNRMVSPSDCTLVEGECRLNDAALKLFFTRFEQRLEETVLHPASQHKVTYRRCFELQAHLLARYLVGELPAYTPCVTR